MFAVDVLPSTGVGKAGADREGRGGYPGMPGLLRGRGGGGAHLSGGSTGEEHGAR